MSPFKEDLEVREILLPAWKKQATKSSTDTCHQPREPGRGPQAPQVEEQVGE